MNDFATARACEDPSPGFEASPTPMNHALAATVDRRLRAETRHDTARAACWCLAGVSLLVVAVGAGVGLAFAGYARITDNRAATERLSAAIADGLARVTLHTDGSVKLDSDDARVRLDANGTTVRLDSANAAVRLESSGAMVRLDPGNIPASADPGNARSPRATGKPVSLTPQPPAQAHVVRDFTVFSTVAFGGGNVMTGWKFLSSADAKPNSEYCYYQHGIGSLRSVRWDLGDDGVMADPLPVDLPVGIEAASAPSAPTACAPAEGWAAAEPRKREAAHPRDFGTKGPRIRGRVGASGIPSTTQFDSVIKIPEG
jgi:hypothetical protein